MLEERQVQLFDIMQYGGKKVRGHYKKKEKEVQKLNPYLELAQICTQLANYLPVPIFGELQECYHYDYINLWCEVYTNEQYEYQNEMFDGENYKIIEAELIGTERLNIDNSLYLHKKLFELIKTGLTIHEAAEKLQSEIKRMRVENGKDYAVDKN